MTIASKTISQETFDEAVQQNIDTFDMDPEEAVADAVKEFQMSGVDLSGVSKNYAGENGRGKHPVVALVKALEAALELQSQGDSSVAAAAVQGSLEALATHFREGVEGGVELAGQNGAVELVLSLCRPKCELHSSALPTLRALLASRHNRAFFHQRGGVESVLAHFQSTSEEAGPCSEAQAAWVVAAAGLECEPTKARVMLLGGGEMLVAALVRAHAAGAQQSQPDAVQALCAALRTLCTADDPLDAASGAFRNAQALAKAGAAAALLDVLKSLGPLLQAPDEQVDASAAKLASSVSFTLKGVAANEEVCKQVAEGGGVEVLVAVLQSDASLATASLAKQSCVLMRQLAGSDTIKPLIVSAQGVQAVMRVMEVHAAVASSSNPPQLPGLQAVEAGLSVLAALCLRNPPGAEALAEVGALDAAVELMQNFPQVPNLQRQASMLLRNAVARSKDLLGPKILALGAEKLLVQAKINHKMCVDVGSAALRDLGCDNYNEGWTPTTIIMGADGVERTADDLDEEYLQFQAADRVNTIPE